MKYISHGGCSFDNLDNMLGEIKENNTKSIEERKKKEEESKKKEAVSWIEYKNNLDAIEEVCYSKELFENIQKAGFQIERYFRLPKNGSGYGSVSRIHGGYNEIVEKYVCSYNGWQFTVNHMSDCDIEEGIWSIYGAKNERDNREIKFYLDFGCRNTAEARYDRFILLINSESVEEYSRIVWGKYLELPELLKERGYEASIITTQEELDNICTNERVVIKIYKDSYSCYLVAFRSFHDEIRFVVTNKKDWDINCSNFILDVGAYYVDYKGSEDLDVLCLNIDGYRKHMRNEIGYIEDGLYFRSNDIYTHFINLRKQMAPESINHYLIRFNYMEHSYARETDERFIPNIVNGLELYGEVEVEFNNAAQWSNGNTAFILTFIYEYNRLHDEEVRLHVYGYRLDTGTGKFEFKSPAAETEFGAYLLAEPAWKYAKLDVDDEYIGKPIELMDITDKYIKKFLDAFDIKNNL